MKIVIKRFFELSLQELYDILRIRQDVFVIEQKCIYQDLDYKDQHSYHIIIIDNDEIKAYLRVIDNGISQPEVSFGRVLTTDRKKGYGNILLGEAIKLVKNNYDMKFVRIEAQVYAKGFYEKFGFKQVSDPFLEDGIPHIEMLLEL